MAITPPELDRRRFQYSLRSLFGILFCTAVYFSIGQTLGYVDATAILFGIVLAMLLIAWPPRVYLITAILIAVCAGVLLWANLRPNRWAKDFGIWPPDDLDSVARSMFYRGWPVSPSMHCRVVNLSKTVLSATEVYAALAFDFFVYLACLFFVRFVAQTSYRLINEVRSNIKGTRADLRK
jgi:hypothetical protein